MPSSLHDTLPLEIIDLIIRCCSREELYNLCLVDRTFGQLTTPQLYHTINAFDMEWGQPVTFPFPLNILIHGHLGPLIRNLYIPDLDVDYNCLVMEGSGGLLEKHRFCLDSKYFAEADWIPFSHYLWADALKKMPNLKNLKLGGCDSFFDHVQDVSFKLDSLYLFRCVTMKLAFETFLASQTSLRHIYLQDMCGDAIAEAPYVWEPAFSRLTTAIDVPLLRLIGWQNSTPAADVRVLVGNKSIQGVVVDLAGFDCSAEDSLMPFIAHIEPTTAAHVRTGVFVFNGTTPTRHHLQEIFDYYHGLETVKFIIHPFRIEFLLLALSVSKAAKSIHHLVIEGSVNMNHDEEGKASTRTLKGRFLEQKGLLEQECDSLHFASFRLIGSPELRIENLDKAESCTECKNLCQNCWEERPIFPTRSWSGHVKKV